MVADLKDLNGNLISDGSGKAELLYSVFASVFVGEPQGALPVFDIRYHRVPVTSLKTDMETLTKHLKNLNTNKFMGQYGCHPRVLR